MNTLWPAARVSCISNAPQTMDSVTTWHSHTHSNEVGLIVTPHLMVPIMSAEPYDRLSWSWWTTSHHSVEDHNLNRDFFLKQFIVQSAWYLTYKKRTIKVHTRINSSTYYIGLQTVQIRAVHHNNTHGFRMSQLYEVYFLIYRLILPPHSRMDARHKASKCTEVLECTNIQHVMPKTWTHTCINWQ